ncbi:hypothetical protein KGA66_22710 [Actinocrinis puniceicyclus]|uniref:Uncharacterized protein n=1 Tax=Actinocrinis puniceicyclus TaxID=977794 RepID=A0A8J7WNX2_9ACTN|nr:hypothetical protein [Actinocrinis puniceicyclus]MBS2965878.1 hypothetical protein [Actinocrinis puniceicyclus]
MRAVRLSALAASLSLVAAAGAVIGPEVLRGPETHTAATSPVRHESATASASASPSASGLSEQWMINSLESLLPAGAVFSDPTGRGTQADRMLNAVAPFASVVVHIGGGSSQVDVALYRVAAGTPVTATSYSACPGSVEHPYGVCSSRTLADGSLLVTDKDYVRPQTGSGQQMWTVVAIRGDGSIIEVTEYGGGAEKSTTDSADPILSTDRLVGIAQSSVWQPVLASMRAPAGHTGGAPAFMGRAKVIATLTGLLPSGLTKSDQSGQSGPAELIVDDGHGKSALEVNVQPNMTALADSMNCASRAGQNAVCSAPTLPDGTKEVVTRQPSANARNVVEWMVDALRPDGLRVVVFEFNAASASGPPTRPAPALTIAQLSQIATSQTWRQ